MNARPERFDGWDERYTALDREAVRSAFAGTPLPVASIAALVDDEPQAIVVSSLAVGVSYAPPMCSFAVQLTSSTWPMLTSAKRMGISVLGAAHADAVRQLASRARERRFEGVGWTALPSGAVMLYDSPLWLECRIAHRFPVGDHELVAVEVVGSSVAQEHDALLVHGQRFGSYIPRD